MLINYSWERGIQGAPCNKNLLNRWLPQMNEVIAFHSALPKDGGSGAIYVLLKRKIRSDKIVHDPHPLLAFILYSGDNSLH